MGTSGAWIHGLALALVNLASVVAGFVAFRASGSGRQMAVQIPVALAVSVIAFVIWVWLTRRYSFGWRRQDWRSRLGVFGLAMLWAALIYAPLHLLTQGYVTALSNVVALWAFQVPANCAALAAAEVLAVPAPGR